MKERHWTQILASFIILLGIPAYFVMQRSVHNERAFHNSSLSPLIFIPGSSASQDRFDNLFQNLNANKTKHSILKLTVQTNKTVKVTGNIAARDRQPFVVIAFQNNHDGYENIAQQTKWLQVAMTYLIKNYNFNNFQAIGHSNGGLIWTWYLEKYFDANDLTINSLTTIGTPYNSLESNPKNQTAIFRQLYQNRKRIPQKITVFSIAGNTNYQDDGIVPAESVDAGKYIFQEQVQKYTQLTVTGADSTHSSVLANPQVTRLIHDNLINRHNNFNKPKKQ
ncbi:alpha/beta hydrolase [Lactobacillus sp. DCY120]|uniref:Alpha/beta hydrolase n=1 Tax=Bombilactobacillus apium TaxID=2675299 RepID=A0A850QZ87_9LACO|nr:alpha/beta hydrolase [Bombilactobacillus apium]NVY97154.1 alpha/beta hydrolase [Bombilactobacillus apium]